MIGIVMRVRKGLPQFKLKELQKISINIHNLAIQFGSHYTNLLI